MKCFPAALSDGLAAFDVQSSHLMYYNGKCCLNCHLYLFATFTFHRVRACVLSNGVVGRAQGPDVTFTDVRNIARTVNTAYPATSF